MFLVSLTSPAALGPLSTGKSLEKPMYLLRSLSKTNLPLTPALSGTITMFAFPLTYSLITSASPRFVNAPVPAFTINDPAKASSSLSRPVVIG